MGAGYTPSPKELMYKSINYSNEKTIQGLVRFYYALRTETEYKFNSELLTTLIDIELAIKNSDLTDRQRTVLQLYMKGWTEDDIGKKLDITQQGVSKHIQLICRKLSNYLTS